MTGYTHRESRAAIVVASIFGMSLLVATGGVRAAQPPAPRDAAPGALHDVQAALGLARATIFMLDAPARLGAPFTVVVPGDGRPMTLELARHSVRSEDYRVLVQRADGTLDEVEPEPVRTVRGAVVGVAGSTVTGSLSEDGLTASVQLPGRGRLLVEPVARFAHGAEAGLHVIYREEDAPGLGGTCGVQHEPIDVDLDPALEPDDAQGGAAGAGPCVTELACDADFEFFQDYGSVAGVENRINAVIGSVNGQYEGQTGITHLITAIVVRSDPNDPYTSSSSGTLLGQFRDEWLTNQTGIQRDVAKLFTGRSINGGIIGEAWVIGGICEIGNHYCYSWSDCCGGFACATDLAAHELGHLWGAFHCSCPGNTMNPTITCNNLFSATSISSISTHRDSRTCLDDCGGGGPTPGCGEPGTGLCDVDNGTPYCEDADCCTAICAADSFCCQTQWDQQCADDANVICYGGPIRPPNDNCGNSISLTVGSVAFDTTAATEVGPDLPAACDEGFGLDFDADVWYLFQPQAPGTLTVSTCGQADFDTRLAAYTGVCGTLTLAACNDDSTGCAGSTSEMVFTVACDDLVWIRVGGYDGATGTGTLTLSLDGTTCDPPVPPPPPNDDCDDAITVAAGATAFTTLDATTDGLPDSICNANGQSTADLDVWFRYVTPCDGDFIVSLCGADFDTRLVVYDGSCPTVFSEAIACDDDACGLQSEVTVAGEMGVTYHIRIGGFGGASGSGTMTLTAPTCIPAPLNDSCGTATTAGLGTISYSSFGATTDGPLEAACPGADIQSDVWFRYFSLCTETLSITTTGDFDTSTAVYTGCPAGPDTAIACANDAGTGSTVSFAAASGTLYRIRIGSPDGSTGSGDVSISCGTPCPGDTDGSGDVNIDDVVNVVLDFGTDGSANGGDADGSGFVDVDDVVFVVLNFGTCP